MIDFAELGFALEPVLPAREVLDSRFDHLAEIAAGPSDVVLLGDEGQHEGQQQEGDGRVGKRGRVLRGHVAGGHHQQNADDQEPEDAGL